MAGLIAEDLAALRAEFDVVLCEGAGSPAEINLRATDLANMGLACSADLPVVVVGDIDRGGVLAHLFGTVAVLEPADQALVAGFIINKFRAIRAFGARPRAVGRLTGRPTYGVVPHSDELWMDAEDSRVGGGRSAGRQPGGPAWFAVPSGRRCGCRGSPIPPTSKRWPANQGRGALGRRGLRGGRRRWSSSREAKATVADLQWLRRRGLADAIASHARRGRTVLGVCGGFQMLCRSIEDNVESGSGAVPGWACSRWTSRSGRRRPCAAGTVRCTATRFGTDRLRADEEGWFWADGTVEGYRRGNVFGTHWHGLLDNDGFRGDWLSAAAGRRTGPASARRGHRRSAPRRPTGPDGRSAGGSPGSGRLLALLDGAAPSVPVITSTLGGLP